MQGKWGEVRKVELTIRHGFTYTCLEESGDILLSLLTLTLWDHP